MRHIIAGRVMFMIQIFPLEEDCLEFAGTEPIVCSYAYIYIYAYTWNYWVLLVCVKEVIGSHEIKSDPDNDDDDKYDNDNDNNDNNGNDNGNDNDQAVRHVLPLVVTLENNLKLLMWEWQWQWEQGQQLLDRKLGKLSWWLNGLHSPHDSSHILM